MKAGSAIGSLSTGVFITVFFLIGGIAFTIAIPDIWIGQIWIVVALILGAVFFFLARRQMGMEKIRKEGIRGEAHVLGGEQTGTQVNDQPVMKLKLRVTAPGVQAFETTKRVIVPIFSVGRLGTGQPLPVYFRREQPEKLVIDWDEAMAQSATLPQGGVSGAPQAGGMADRANVLRTLSEHGVDVAHAQAAADPSTTVQSADNGSASTLDRLQKLMELKNAQLISDEEFAEHKKRILGEV